MKKLIPIILVLFAAGAGAFYLVSSKVDETVERSTIVDVSQDSSSSQNTSITEVEVGPLAHSLDEVDSLWLIVNKQRPISLDYIPKSLRRVNVQAREDKSEAELSMRDDAATALESLFADALVEDIELLLGSGYRDSDLQNTYYTRYINAYGQAEADKFSAKPGTSEHQTGLVADVAPLSRNCYLEICFGDTAEGRWVRENAHKYGFVIRYPEGKESITGYQFEPWHLRFVGTELATELFTDQVTLEEYFDLVSG